VWELRKISDGLNLPYSVLEVFPLKMLHRRASIVLMSIIRKAAGLRKLTIYIKIAGGFLGTPPSGPGPPYSIGF